MDMHKYELFATLICLQFFFYQLCFDDLKYLESNYVQV